MVEGAVNGDRRLMTVQDVAANLQVGPHAVRKWLRRGALQGRRLPGGQWRVTQNDIEAMMGQETNQNDE